MRELYLKGNQHSPAISFNPAEGKFEMSGESRPEDPREYFLPVVEWLEDFSQFTAGQKENKEIHFTFRLEYMNSISTKIIYDILRRLETLPKSDVVIDWHYQSDDIDMQENGEEFSRMVNLKFKFHSWE
jgi:hypothetical protein